MKQLTCEMCGSTDLIKQDGVFVCQSCGVKYTVEEAKKMIIEGTVNVQGSVSIDNAQKLANMIILARRAKNDGNFKDAKKYYDMILLEDTENWEAVFYHTYFRAVQSSVEEIETAAMDAGRAAISALDILSKNNDKDYTESAVGEIASSLINLSSTLFDVSRKEFEKCHKEKDWDIRHAFIEGNFSRNTAIFMMLTSTADKIWEVSAFNKTHAVDLYISALENGVSAHFEKYNDPTIIERIHEQKPDYENPVTRARNSGGCYVATAVYGSYDCPQVWTLRRFRDYTLAVTWYGRAFIRTYYAISPTLVKWFGHTAWFKNMWRGKLDRMVAKLQSDGVESIPYIDREW